MIVERETVVLGGKFSEDDEVMAHRNIRINIEKGSGPV